MRGRSLAGHFDPEALSRKAASAFLLRRPNVRSADIHQIELCDRSWPRLCENARALFLGVNFSHVDAISGDFSHRIHLLAILRGERKVFSHSLIWTPPVCQGVRCDASIE